MWRVRRRVPLTTAMHKTLLLVPLLATACSYPSFVAKKVVELDVPLSQASKLHCKSHNGDITIARGTASDSVHIKAILKVRGYTQQEADANLELLSVADELDDDTLRIYGDYPRPELNGMSPTFTYTMNVPSHLDLNLVTHNGDVTARGTTGATRVETHNGNIVATSANKKTRVETHNGDIDLVIRSSDDLEGRVITHNGDIDVELVADAHCWLEVFTHNGRIRTPRVIHDASIKRRSVRCRIGEGDTEGRLFIKTHNGDVGVHDLEPGNRKKLK